jgi:hypothetical protein
VFVRMYSALTECDRERRFLTRVAVPWIHQLGTRALMLRKLKVDLGHVYPSHCDTGYHQRHNPSAVENAIDYGRLLCTLWKLDLFTCSSLAVTEKGDLHRSRLRDLGKTRTRGSKWILLRKPPCGVDPIALTCAYRARPRNTAHEASFTCGTVSASRSRPQDVCQSIFEGDEVYLHRVSHK